MFTAKRAYSKAEEKGIWKFSNFALSYERAIWARRTNQRTSSGSILKEWEISRSLRLRAVGGSLRQRGTATVLSFRMGRYVIAHDVLILQGHFPNNGCSDGTLGTRKEDKQVYVADLCQWN